MNINAGNPSLQNILLHNMKEKKRPTFSAVFEKLNKHSGKLNTKSPLNSVLTNEQMFRYYVKDTMPQLDKSNDTFGESEEGSMMSSMMSKLGLNEPSFNSNNIQTLEGTTNNLPFQMGDGSATAQGEPFVPDGSNNAFTGITPPKQLTLSKTEYDDYDFAYGSGAGFYIKQLIKYFNDPSNNHGVNLEGISYDDFFDGDQFDNIIDELNNDTFKNANFDSPEAEQFFDAVYGSGTLNTMKKMIKSNPKLENMKFEDLVDLIRSKSNSKYGFIDDIVDDMLSKSTGKHDFIRDIVNDVFDNATDENYYNIPFRGESDEAGSKEIDYDIDFLKVFYSSFGDKNKIMATMSPQQISEYQMLSEEYNKLNSQIHERNQNLYGGSDLTGNRFQNSNVKPKKIVFDDDFKKVFFADSDLQLEAKRKMPLDRYNEFISMRKEYQKLDYEIQVKDLVLFQGDDIKADNRFFVEYNPSEFEKGLDKLKVMNMPPPEQSITVRPRGAPRKPDTEGTEAQVKARKNAREKYKELKLPIESRSGATKGRYTKSPVKRGIKDL